ncbi:MAG: tRNA (N(6)-L-threonylcarbamoyladenosine(37)-C(2))-methylthiotransferase, partial [Candidatus Thorarchaeota archaeon]
MANFFIETFGCTANTSATELMTYLLTNCGHIVTKNIDTADFVLINTCIVKAPTENKIKNLLLRLSNSYPLIVAGCLPQVLTNWCKENIPNAALIGVDHYGDVCFAADAILNNQSFEALSRKDIFCSENKRNRVNPLTGIIEISKGCTGQCAYCIVKFAKGILVSKNKEQILTEVQTAINDGCKEIWLTAQDTASYGHDINSSLPEIIDSISQINGDFMIRIGMMNPDFALSIIDGLKKTYQNPKVYSFAHIPVQSGSNTVLQEMKRKYTIEEFYELIDVFRKELDLTLSTDIIAGFPGETASDHIETLNLLKEVKFDIVNISKYGDRPGTLASKVLHKIPTEIIKERSTEISKIVNEMTLERN